MSQMEWTTGHGQGQGQGFLDMTTELQWIDNQREEMINLLQEWANINSSTDHLDGLAAMLHKLKQSFSELGGELQQVNLPPRISINDQGQQISTPNGQALHIIKRPEAPLKVLLAGHMDTVYPKNHPFQTVEFIDANTMRGPGVADMKGGLLIMLTALKTLERHPLAKNIGWEIVINPDEEVGSHGSEALLIECAKRSTLGLIFEPSFYDGAIVSSRKGSANWVITAKGRAAHAGRDFEKGRNAITALAKVMLQVESLSDKNKGITVNIGNIIGGGPINVVPEHALCRINTRTVTQADFSQLADDLQRIVADDRTEGVHFTLNQLTARGPKPFDAKTQLLFEQLDSCAREEGYSLTTRSSGGVCDGNLLSEYGLPVVDTLGAIGGEIHTTDEYILIDSLVKRARLIALYLIKLATGQMAPPKIAE